jgi:hypothetical protein
VRLLTYQDSLDFPALLEELASGDCVFYRSVELNRWDAMGCYGGDRDDVALLVKAWVPGLADLVGVRLPPTDANREAVAGLVPEKDRLAFVAPFERAYLDYPEDSVFEVTEQHVLYALGVERMEA